MLIPTHAYIFHSAAEWSFRCTFKNVEKFIQLRKKLPLKNYSFVLTNIIVENYVLFEYYKVFYIKIVKEEMGGCPNIKVKSHENLGK